MKIAIFQDFKTYIHLFINLMFYFKGKSSLKSTFYVLWVYGFNSLLVFLRFFRIFLDFSWFLELFRLVLLPFNAQRSWEAHVLLLIKIPFIPFYKLIISFKAEFLWKFLVLLTNFTPISSILYFKFQRSWKYICIFMIYFFYQLFPSIRVVCCSTLMRTPNHNTIFIKHWNG